MKKLAVVGLGYVGLPVACAFARAGFQVSGIDIDEKRVSMINSGENPIKGKEPGLDELLTMVIKEGMFRAYTDYDVVKEADVVTINVNTPVDERNMPRYGILEKAVRSVGENIKRGALVIVESTIAPTTMRNMVLPLLEETSGMKGGRDFYLAHCPERVMVGRLLYNLENYNRVVGGLDKKSTDLAIEFYRHVVKGELLPTDMTTAEISKTAENAYRDVQIAFANEVALICEAVGSDAYEVRKLVNSAPYRDMHIPGAGVGGHCLPKDPYLLLYPVDRMEGVLTAARRRNDFMPHHMVELLYDALDEAGVELSIAKVVVLGKAFLGDSDDIRNSPALHIIRELDDKCELVVHDPFVEGAEKDLEKAMTGADAVLIVTDHSEYKGGLPFDVMRQRIVIDGRNLVKDTQGLIYRGIGKSP